MLPVWLVSLALKNLVVGYDGFERDEPLPALPVALAREHGARLHLVHVAPGAPLFRWGGASAEQWHADLLATRRERLAELAAAASGGRLDVRVVVRSGAPHVELIRECLTVGADLITVTDEARSSGGARGFGSVTMKLLRFCPCPVLANRDGLGQRHERIVAAVDLDPEEDGSLNRAIVRAAAILAQRNASRVTLYHAWQLWGAGLLGPRSRLSPDQLQGIAADTGQSRESEMKRLVERARLEGLEARPVLERGDVRELLPGYVERESVDVVVMGTLARTGLEGFFMGNTAESLVNALSASVLAVKPAGFRGPVAPSNG